MITLIFDLCYASNQYFSYVFAYVIKITYTLFLTANIQSKSPRTYQVQLRKVKKSAKQKWCFFLITKTVTFVLMNILYLYFLFRVNKQNTEKDQYLLVLYYSNVLCMMLCNLVYNAFFFWLTSLVLIQMYSDKRKYCSPTFIWINQAFVFLSSFLATSLRNIIVPPSHIKPVILILKHPEFFLSLYEDQNPQFQALKKVVFIIMLV